MRPLGRLPAEIRNFSLNPLLIVGSNGPEGRKLDSPFEQSSRMKRLFDSTWFAALKRWRTPRRVDPDAGDMGTAFGLDSITVVDFETSAAQSEFSNSAMNDWHRRLTRRSRL